MSALSPAPLLRPLADADPPVFAAAFAAIGWHKPASQFEAYLRDQTLGLRDVIVAEADGVLAGYVTIVWAAYYPPFREASIPEIVDLNVLPHLRRQGVGSALLNEAERRIGERSAVAGIGVGLTADYGAAQRLYARRGYVPDGRGITTTGDRFPRHGETVTVDDDLVLHLTKAVK